MCLPPFHLTAGGLSRSTDGTRLALHTPLHDLHVALGARMVDFGGWDMPVNYGSQIEEHHAVRRAAGLFDVSHMCIVDLRGVRVREFLRQLLDRYNGSRVKALAAYNAGPDAVAKWERRYGGRDADEFVELITYRETRDYVKAVLRNYRIYRLLYVESPSTTSDGRPPNAPFDMIAMTSPGRADATR